MTQPIVPTLLAIADADSLADWLAEGSEASHTVACAGMDFRGYPFTAWVDLWSDEEHPTHSQAVACVAGSDRHFPAGGLAFPVWVITATTKKE